MRLLRALLGATVLLTLNSIAQAQTFTQVQWGIARASTPQSVALMNGSAPLASIGSYNANNFLFNPFNVSSLELQGGKSGGVFDNAAIISALSPGTYSMCLGNYRTAGNATVPIGVVLSICAGSSLAPDVATTTTFRGSVNPNVYTKIFTGSGTVTGLSFARPEWWGITGTADNISIQKAINSIENSFGSDGSRQEIGYACTVYNLLGGITYSPTNLFNDYVNACGSGNTGTTFNAAPGFSGTTLITIAGQARGSPGVTASYNIGNFQATNSSGIATLACIDHAVVSGTQLEGNQENPLHDINCGFGFKYGYSFGASRNVHGDRLSFFSSVPNAVCFQFKPNDALSFVGDSDFTRSVCAPNQGTGTVTSADTTNTSYAYFGTPNGGGVAGIGLAGDFYKSNNGIIVQALNGATNPGSGVSDITIGGKAGRTQFDGLQCNVLDISANSVGTAVGTTTLATNIVFDPDYVRGVVSNCAMVRTSVNQPAGAGTAIVDSTQIGGGGGYFANLNGYGVIYSGATNSSVLNSRWLADGFAGTSAIKITGGSKSINISGNTCQGGINSAVTISNASPGVVTWAGHGLTAGALIQFDTNGTLPSGLTTNTTYYVIAAGLTTNAFEVSATAGGTAINTGSAGSGTHTAYASNTGFIYDQFLLVDTNTDYINALPTAMNGLCGTEIVSTSAGTHNSLNPTGTFVTGPSSSTNGDIATFSGTTGGVIQDSGKSFAAPGPLGDGTPSTGAFTTLSATGQITSTLAIGTAPFSIASTSKVVNLYADRAASADAMASTGFANPTASVGLTAVNGTATTAMRSDGAPALSQAIVPTWTGTHTFAEAIVSTKATGTAPFTVASTTQVSNLFATKAATANAWTTARNLAGNSVDGSANVAFANKFIVQGTTDAGLSAAQFLGALGTGLVKNTTTTGILSIATAGTDYLTSVGASFTGGLISVGSSPLTANGTLAFTVAGTSGGIPYFASTSTWASSALLSSGAIMLGGGAGNPPTTTTTGTGVVTALGVNVGSAGAFVTNGGALGTPSSGTLSSATGLPISTGVSGLGTGIATALAVNTGSAGAPVLFNGAGGTPSSLTLTNATALPAASVSAGALANTMTATTQTASNNSTRLATTAYVDAQPVTATQLGGMSVITNTLGAPVALNNTANYFDGPSIAQGTSGTWFVTGTVVLDDTTSANADFLCKLWDGTTIIQSAYILAVTTNKGYTITMSGKLATPAANIRISCRDATSANGFIQSSFSGLGSDSVITAIRIQ